MTGASRATALLVCVLAATACTAGDGTGQESTATPTSSGETSPSGTTGSSTQGTNLIDWILNLGVGAPPGPASEFFEAYEALRNQDCESALEQSEESEEPDSGDLVAAAATACLAAGTGDEALWDEAEAARDAGLVATSCLDHAVSALLDRLVEAHEAHPDRTFEFVAGGGPGEPPCPSISELDPDHGVPLDTVTIRGTHLGLVTQVDVRVGDVVCEMSPVGDDGALQIRIPEPSSSSVATAEVVLVTPPADWDIDSATFAYDEPTEEPTTSDPSSGSDPSSSDPSSTSDPTPTVDSPDELDCS